MALQQSQNLFPKFGLASARFRPEIFCKNFSSKNKKFSFPYFKKSGARKKQKCGKIFRFWSFSEKNGGSGATAGYKRKRVCPVPPVRTRLNKYTSLLEFFQVI